MPNGLTTASGAPIGDDQNSLTGGPRGPVVMEDYLLFERTARLNRAHTGAYRARERLDRVRQFHGPGLRSEPSVSGSSSK